MALNERRGGMTANIRVSPKDCLATLDLMEKMGLNPHTHSFAGCVSLCYSSLIALARRQGVIKEEEDGFQYMNRMEPFRGQKSTKVKREHTNALYEGARQGGTPPVLTAGDIIPIHTPFDRAAGMAEYESLKPIATEHMSAGNVDTPEVARFLELQDKLF